MNAAIVSDQITESCFYCGFRSAPPHEGSSRPTLPAHHWHLRNRASLDDYIASLADETREWLIALYVDDRLNLLSVNTLAQGSIDSCKVSISDIHYFGRLTKAAAFFLVHNHPSGDPRPSLQDIAATKRIARSAEELDMPLLDHLIVAKGGIRSVGYF